MKYTTLLIDLDETLFDFSKSEKFAIDKLMEKYNIPVTEENRRLYSAINDEKWKKLERGELTRQQLFHERFAGFLKKTGVTADTDEANLSYMKFLSQASFILDGALETCKKLSENYSLYLVTNGTKIVQNGRLNGSPIMKYIKGVFISEEIGFNKPQKEYFAYVLEHIEERDKKKILVVGDSPSSDIAGAINSGLDSCLVNRKNQNVESGATYTISYITEIFEVLS